MKGVAFEYLTDLQRAQLQHCRPELFNGMRTCPRCSNGQILNGQCLQCSCELDENGQEIRGKQPDGKFYGFHTSH